MPFDVHAAGCASLPLPGPLPASKPTPQAWLRRPASLSLTSRSVARTHNVDPSPFAPGGCACCAMCNMRMLRNVQAAHVAHCATCAATGCAKASSKALPELITFAATEAVEFISLVAARSIQPTVLTEVLFPRIRAYRTLLADPDEPRSEVSKASGYFLIKSLSLRHPKSLGSKSGWILVR